MSRHQPLNTTDFARYYALLQLRGAVDWAQVQSAYRRLAQQLHPDKAPDGDADAFHQLNRAYRDLKRYHDMFEVLPPAEPVARGPQRPPPRPEPSAVPPRKGVPAFKIMLLLAIPPLAYLLWPQPAPPPPRPATIQLEAPAPIGQPQVKRGPRIRVGMTKAEVLKIQGAPLIMEQREWNYGVSKVFFTGGAVTGWYNSRAGPLRVYPSKYGLVGKDER